jgi:hypothetical protein
MKNLLLAACAALALPFMGCSTVAKYITPAALTSEVSQGIKVGLDVYPQAAPEVAIARDAICANASNGVVDPQQIVNNLEALGITNSNTKLIVDGALLVYEGVYVLVGTNNTAVVQPYMNALCAGFTAGLPLVATSRRTAQILPPHLK